MHGGLESLVDRSHVDASTVLERLESTAKDVREQEIVVALPVDERQGCVAARIEAPAISNIGSESLELILRHAQYVRQDNDAVAVERIELLSSNHAEWQVCPLQDTTCTGYGV